MNALKVATRRSHDGADRIGPFLAAAFHELVLRLNANRQIGMTQVFD
jgi:hypothetical protein